MKKILLIIGSLKLGGMGRVAINTVKALSGLFDISIVIFWDSSPRFSPLCKVINIDIPETESRFCNRLNILRRSCAIKRIKRQINPDFTVSFAPGANIVNVLTKGIGKTLTSLHGFTSVSSKLSHRFMYTHSDAIICVSKVIYRSLIQVNSSYLHKARLLYNPIDISEIMRMGDVKVDDYDFNRFTIVSVGQLEAVKNYSRLIKAFSIVHHNFKGTQLLVIGDGPMRKQLEGLISDYHLQEEVTLIGFRDNPFAYMSKSSLYVLSSYSEGFGLALVEGMVFLPVVAVDCKAGPREILSNGSNDLVCGSIEEADYGILVKPEENIGLSKEIVSDDVLLADAMLLFLQQPERLRIFGDKARKRADTFSMENYKENLLDVIHALERVNG